MALKNANYNYIHITPPQNSDIVIGNQSSKYKILVYTDYECPFCRDVDEHVPKWISAFGSTTVSFYLRHLPLTDIHPRALEFARAVECVKRLYGDAEAFSFGKYTYDNRTAALAKILDNYQKISPYVSAAEIQSCSQKPEITAYIKNNAYEALLNDLRRTPSFAIFDTEKNMYVFQNAGGGVGPYNTYFKAFFEAMHNKEAKESSRP